MTAGFRFSSSVSDQFYCGKLSAAAAALNREGCWNNPSVRVDSKRNTDFVIVYSRDLR